MTTHPDISAPSYSLFSRHRRLKCRLLYLSSLLLLQCWSNILVSAANYRPNPSRTGGRLFAGEGWWRRRGRGRITGTFSGDNSLSGNVSRGGHIDGPPSASSQEADIKDEIKFASFQDGETANQNSRDVSSTVAGLSEEEVHGWRESLPPSLRDRSTLHRFILPVSTTVDSSVVVATDGVAVSEVEVYLLGTSHISKDSCKDVRILMEYVQPDCLFMELCPQRLAILQPPPTSPLTKDEEQNVPKGLAAQAKQAQESQGLSRPGALGAVLLTKIQSDYAEKLNVTIGGEFRVAYEVVVEQNRRALMMGVPSHGGGTSANPCVVVLGDRPLRLTLLRAWESLSVFGKIRLILGLVWSSIWQPSEKKIREWMDSIMNGDNDILTESIEELSKHFPTIGRVVIAERDQYMSSKLRQTARLLAPTGGGSGIGQRKKLVAVVGAGHCPGICRLLLGEGGDSREEEKKFVSPEDVLRSVVETKRWKVDESEDMQSLVADVIELHSAYPS